MMSSRSSSSPSTRYLPRRPTSANVEPATAGAASNFGDGNDPAATTVRPRTCGASARRIVSTSGSSGIDGAGARLVTGPLGRATLGRRLHALARIVGVAHEPPEGLAEAHGFVPMHLLAAV